MYTLPQIVNESSADLDIRGVSHRGYLHPLLTLTVITNANISLIDIKTAEGLFQIRNGQFIPKPTIPARPSIWKVHLSRILLSPMAV